MTPPAARDSSEDEDASADRGGDESTHTSAPVPGADEASGGSPKPVSAHDIPLVERRARPDRRAVERRVAALPVPVDRRKTGDRRLQSDRRDQGKRGGEYDLDADTLEFIAAVNRFKEATGQTFPTWSDLLGIVRDLGYEKRNY